MLAWAGLGWLGCRTSGWAWRRPILQHGAGGTQGAGLGILGTVMCPAYQPPLQSADTPPQYREGRRNGGSMNEGIL